MPTPSTDMDLDACLSQAAQRFGTPSYVYLTDAIESRIAQIRASLGPWFQLSYAMKCNPNPALLGWLASRIEDIDVSSIGEFRLARSAGWDAARASFTGPGKREAEIRQAVEAGLGELVVENLREARLADRAAADIGRRQDILIRLAPSSVPKGFGDQMAGRPSPFGFDIETADEELPQVLALPHLNLVGLHIYSGTQCLKPLAICDNYRIFMSIFRDICDRHDITPRKLVFGSGLGVPYHPEDKPLDLQDVAQGIGSDLDAFQAQPRFSDTRLVLELGRFLVAEAGYFLTSVIGTKLSRGRNIAICDGGMNNHLPASGHFGMVIHRNYRMHRVGGGEATERYNIVGPLCTSIDRLAGDVAMPALAEGDVVAIHVSGAYGLTASPLHFISHPLPREVLVDGRGMQDVTWLAGPQVPTLLPDG